MPYVTASIIVQLMTVVIPRLSELQKEGESGYAKINQYTRYLTVVLAAAQALGYAFLFKNQGSPAGERRPDGADRRHAHRRHVLLMWMGEQITKRGIGNGISILIFASILTGLPLGVTAWWNGGPMERIFFPLIALAIVAAVVFVQEGQRKIPIQYAKRMVGRQDDVRRLDLPAAARQHGRRHPRDLRRGDARVPADRGAVLPGDAGLRQHVLPAGRLALPRDRRRDDRVFAFFYTAVQFNPVDQADNLRKHGGYIPGSDPGRPPRSTSTGC